jgi:hypothetical protein
MRGSSATTQFKQGMTPGFTDIPVHLIFRKHVRLHKTISKPSINRLCYRSTDEYCTFIHDQSPPALISFSGGFTCHEICEMIHEPVTNDISTP